MLGLGESEREVEQAMDDLREYGVDVVTFGQYCGRRCCTCRCANT